MSREIAQFHALARFGMGMAAGGTLPDDPHAWVVSSLDAPFVPVSPPVAAPATATPAIAKPAIDPAERDAVRAARRALFRAECAAEIAQAMRGGDPVGERLAWLWANHFTVSFRKGQVQEFAGSYLRDAIRPNVGGRFSDMLLAVMRHPAMLVYLDNATSVGPHSDVGVTRDKGLNENLARECLELHTVTPASGYTQADVTSFAAILTGWSIDRRADPPCFLFRPHAHEPGPKTLMGMTFPEGEAGGVMALEFLARHPDTQRNVARRLLTHYVADDPSERAVARIAAILARTDGDMRAATRAVFGMREAWIPGTKLRSPFDLVIATGRALNLPADDPASPGDARLAHMMADLGQPLWGALLPNGWPDRASDWASPSAVMSRADFAYAAAGQAGDADPDALADATLGPLASPALKQAMAHAGSRRDALTLLLASPDFQRR